MEGNTFQRAVLGALLPPIGAQKHRAASAPMPAEGERAASPKSLSRRTSEDDRQSHKDIKLMFNQMKPRLTATSAADKVPRNGCNIRPPTASRSSTHSCHPSWADANRVIESLQALVLNHSLEEQIESPRLRSAAAAAACGAAASRSARVSRDSSMRGDNDAAAVAAAAAGGEPTDIGMQDFMEFMVSRRLSGQDVDTGAAASVKVPSKLTVESLVGGSRRDSTALAVAEPVVPPLEWSRSLPELNPSAPSTRRSRSTSASDRLAAAAPAPLSFGDSAGDLYHITLNPNAAANGTGNSGSVRALSRRSTGDSLGLGMPPVPEASDLPYMHDLLTSFDPSALQSQIGHSQLFEEAPRLSAPQRQSSSASQLSWATTAGRPRGKPYFSPELIAKMRMTNMLHEEAHSKLGQRSPNKAAAQGQQRAQRGTAAPHVTNSAVMRSSGDAGGIEAQTSRASLRDSQTLRHSSIGNARSPQPLLSARSSAGGAAVHGSSRLSRPASVAGSHQAMPAAPRGAGRSSSASSAGRAISERASATQALVRRTTYEELLNVFKPDPRGGYKLKKVAAGVRVRRPSVAVRSRRTTAVAEAPEAAQQQQQPLEAADQQAHLDDNNASAAQASHQEQLEAWEMEAASKVVEVLEMTRQRASAVAYNAAEDAAAVAAVPPPAPLWPRRQRRQKSLARGLVYFWKFN